MPSRSIILWLLIWFGLCLELHGQSYRQGLSYTPQRVFRDLLRFSDAGDFDKVALSTQFITPLIDALGKKEGVDFGSQIQEAVSGRAKAPLLKAARGLVVSDLKDLLSFAVENAGKRSFAEASQQVRLAYEDYLLLSPYVQARDSRVDQETKDLFRKLQASIGGGGTGEAHEEVVQAILRFSAALES